MQLKDNGKNGTLKHRLVSYVQKYERILFLIYVDKVVNELDRRNIKYQKKYYDEIKKFTGEYTGYTIYNYPEHNNKYLTQCYYNLQEKYDRGIISDKEWEEIEYFYMSNLESHISRID